MHQFFKPYSKHFILFIIFLNLSIAAYSIFRDYATEREAKQIPAGLSNWRLGSFRFVNETPPLPRMLAASPIFLTGFSDSFLAYVDRPIYLTGTIQDQISSFFAYENASRFVNLVRLARLAGLAWWLLGAWVIFHWSRSLYGEAAGYLALALWCFEPNILIYEPLATPDLPASVAILTANYVFLGYLRNPSWERTLVAGLMLGVAQASEFSALILYGIWPAMAVIQHVKRHNQRGIRWMLHGCAQAVAMGLLSVWSINLCYGLSDTGRLLGDFKFSGCALGGTARSPDPFHENLAVGNRFHGSDFQDLPVPLPAEYLLGIDQRSRTVEWSHSSATVKSSRVADDATTGDAALLAKVPLGLLAMIFWSTGLAFSRRSVQRTPRNDEISWSLPLLAVGALTVSQAGAGLLPGRILLVIPYGIIAASKLAGYLQARNRKSGTLLVALVVWTIGSGVLISLNPRSYASTFPYKHNKTLPHTAPGQRDGALDLLQLRDWARTHPEARPLNVVVQHVAAPIDSVVGTTTPRLPTPVDQNSPLRYTRVPAPRVGPQPGYFALDRRTLATSDFAYFRQFAPIDSINDSLFIYSITPPQANSVRLHGGLPSLEDSKRQDLLTARPDLRQTHESAFRFRVYENPDGTRTNYAVYVPKGYRNDSPHPLVLFLHGYGDAGTTGRRYLEVGLPRAIEYGMDTHGFLVVCPQGKSGSWHPGSEDAERALAILAEVGKEFNVDSRRIILTGLSNGGSATWDLASSNPDRWAAIVPVSPGGHHQDIQALSHIPCWCFSNCNDEGRYYHNCKLSGSNVESVRATIRALTDAGGSPRYSETLNIGDTHNAWDYAYTQPELWDWLTKQRRR